jgi:response regulator RpfG family c-di-GMP phosphodiesterase
MTLRPLLLVDDEPNVLEALERQLRGRYDARGATSGAAALDMLRAGARFHVIVSDMRMPQMDGVQFLEKAREASPDSTRMMLTGNADQQTAVEAINRGAIFRFLTKPTDSELLVAAIEACGTQHDLVTAERELLENTLSGCVRVLMDILAIADAESFGRAHVLKARAGQIARALKLDRVWAIELAAMFSRVGAVLVPPTVLVKARQEGGLDEYEARLMARIPSLGADLLAQIPRLESIVDILRHQEASFTATDGSSSGPHGSAIPVGSRILKVLSDLAELEDRGQTAARGFFVLRRKKELYDPQILDVAEKILGQASTGSAGFEVSIDRLEAGMKLVADVAAEDGQLFVCAGTTVSPALVERLRLLHQFSRITEPIMVEAPL